MLYVCSVIYPLLLLYYSLVYLSFLQRLASISDAGINHASQLSNAFLGLPLEFGKCEACGATEPDKCEGKLAMFSCYLFLTLVVIILMFVSSFFRSFWVYSSACANIPSRSC